MAGDEDRAQKLLQQVQAALQALGEGRLRTASGLHAVGELRKQLEALAERLHLDLRKVQESIVEHAAMYANCPEVLGGMLQLVFCLDHVKTWIQERDVRVQRAEERLEVLHKEFEDCNMRYTTLEVEVGECNQRASALELRVDPVHTPTTRAPHESPRSQASVAGLTGINAAPQQAVPKFFTVDLQALEHTDENVRKLQDLRRENESLRAQLEDANVEIAAATSAAKAAAAAQAAAAQPPAHLPTQNAQDELQPDGDLGSAEHQASTEHQSTPQALLASLEQLEPMLAALPVGSVPGMSELQEEACEAYGRLRSVVLEAEAGLAFVPAHGNQAWPLGRGGAAPMPGSAAGTAPLWTWRSSANTSEAMANSPRSTSGRPAPAALHTNSISAPSSVAAFSAGGGSGIPTSRVPPPIALPGLGAHAGSIQKPNGQQMSAFGGRSSAVVGPGSWHSEYAPSRAPQYLQVHDDVGGPMRANRLW